MLVSLSTLLVYLTCFICKYSYTGHGLHKFSSYCTGGFSVTETYLLHFKLLNGILFLFLDMV